MDVCIPECREVAGCHSVTQQLPDRSSDTASPGGYLDKRLSSLICAKCEGTWESECHPDSSSVFISPSAARSNKQEPPFRVVVHLLRVFHAFVCVQTFFCCCSTVALLYRMGRHRKHHFWLPYFIFVSRSEMFSACVPEKEFSERVCRAAAHSTTSMSQFVCFQHKT